MIRRLLRTLFSLIFIAYTLAGCVTNELWEDQSIYKPYDEVIDAFLINPQDESIIFLGKKYHYIFEKNEELKFLLEYYDDSAIKFNIKDGAYYADGNTIKANISVTIDKNTLDNKLLEWQKKPKIYPNTISLNGIRYLSNKKVNDNTKKLDKVIHIKVFNKYIIKESVVANVLMTPLAVAVDGVIGVAVAGAWVILSPVMLYDSIKE